MLQDAASLAGLGSWQFDDVSELRGPSANRMQQRHDCLQPVPRGEDPAIQPLPVLVEAFGDRDLLIASQQGNSTDLDQVVLKRSRVLLNHV